MTKSFDNILVPYDNSPNSKMALNKAFELAELSNGKITIIHVISYQKAIAKVVEPYRESLYEHVKKFFNQIERDASRRDVPIKKEILYGNPAEEILNLSKNKKFDIIVMGRRGVTKITGPSLGSVSNMIVQNSRIPVLIITWNVNY